MIHQASGREMAEELFNSEKYQKMFQQLVLSHCEEATWAGEREEKWCAFWPAVGELYQVGGAMIVGRALDGWGETQFAVPQVSQNTEQISNLAQRCQGSFSPKNLACFWEKYKRGGHSKIFQFAKRVAGICSLNGSSNDWPKHIVWNNLARISFEKSGNPPCWSFYAQLDAAASLLDLEIRRLRPGVVVLAVGVDWAAPFRRRLQISLNQYAHLGYKYVCGAGKLADIPVVVCEHPAKRGLYLQKMEGEVKDVLKQLE